MYVDRCGRITKCRMCRTPIKAGESRFVIALDQSTPARGKYGGRIYRSKWFAHPTCITKYFDTFTNSETSSDILWDVARLLQTPLSSTYGRPVMDCCTECEGTTNTLFPARIANQFPPVKICSSCVTKDGWRLCGACSMYVRKYEASLVVTTMFAVEAGEWACDRCVAGLDIMTTKRVEGRARRERKETRRFESLKKELIDRYESQRRSE